MFVDTSEIFKTIKNKNQIFLFLVILVNIIKNNICSSKIIKIVAPYKVF